MALENKTYTAKGRFHGNSPYVWVIDQVRGQDGWIKDLFYGFRGHVSCGTRWVVPSGQDSSILPAQVANHSAGFDSSCPLTELAV